MTAKSRVQEIELHRIDDPRLYDGLRTDLTSSVEILADLLEAAKGDL